MAFRAKEKDLQGKISRSPLRTHSMDTVDLEMRYRNLSTAALTPLSCCPLECPDPRCAGRVISNRTQPVEIIRGGI